MSTKHFVESIEEATCAYDTIRKIEVYLEEKLTPRFYIAQIPSGEYVIVNVEELTNYFYY